MDYVLYQEKWKWTYFQKSLYKYFKNEAVGRLHIDAW